VKHRLLLHVNILGINAYHGDASAALVVDGQLVAAVEEERFNRIKHWAGFPAESIRWCLTRADILPTDIDHVAVSFNPRANMLRRFGFVARHFPHPSAIIDRLSRQGKVLGIREQFANAVGLPAGELKAKLHQIEHQRKCGTAYNSCPSHRGSGTARTCTSCDG